MLLAVINWNIDPYIFKIGTFELPWYGLCFASGFLLGFPIVARIFKIEGKSEKDLDALLITMIAATVIGARAGHYFFYETALLNANPSKFFIEMITPPFRGLASHGAAFAIPIALWIYKRKRPDQTYLWITDRMVIVAALGGACIRFGNLLNHEIVGKATDVPWAFLFKHNYEFSQVPRHPSQLYESLSCLVLFGVLYAIWNRYKAATPQGLLTGIFFVWIFGLRFFYEFTKENQEAFENTMTYNMGQMLSIPLVLFGLVILGISLRKNRAV